MKLTVYPLSHMPPPIRAAPSKREWMDKTPDSFAYRCLPLSIANAHGWDQLIVCGDLCFPGPEPLKVWETLRKHNALVVQGVAQPLARLLVVLAQVVLVPLVRVPRRRLFHAHA